MNDARPWALYVGLPAAVAVLVGASSPAIAQRVRIVGCFDAARAYPADRLVLTYPVKC